MWVVGNSLKHYLNLPLHFGHNEMQHILMIGWRLDLSQKSVQWLRNGEGWVCWPLPSFLSLFLRNDKGFDLTVST